jgi:hypothetical protein
MLTVQKLDYSCRCTVNICPIQFRFPDHEMWCRFANRSLYSPQTKEKSFKQRSLK